jgi:hypothetical protein
VRIDEGPEPLPSPHASVSGSVSASASKTKWSLRFELELDPEPDHLERSLGNAFLLTDFRLQNHLMHTNVRGFMARALTSQNLTDAFDVPATQFVRGVLHRTVPPFLHGASL